MEWAISLRALSAEAAATHSTLVKNFPRQSRAIFAGSPAQVSFVRFICQFLGGTISLRLLLAKRPGEGQILF